MSNEKNSGVIEVTTPSESVQIVLEKGTSKAETPSSSEHPDVADNQPNRLSDAA